MYYSGVAVCYTETKLSDFVHNGDSFPNFYDKSEKLLCEKVRYDDLIEKFENPIEYACDLKEGQVFICEGWQKNGRIW